MTAVSYRESLAGYVDFGADDWNEGWLGGREVRSHCAIHLGGSRSTTSTDFIARPEHLATCTGWVRCDGLGGPARDLGGLVQPARRRGRPAGPAHALPPARPRRPRGGRSRSSGSRTSTTTHFHDPWADTSTLFSRLYAGHLEDGRGTRATARLAAGVLRVDARGLARACWLSIRARGAGPAGRLAAKARWGAMFASRLAGRVHRAGPGRPAGLPLAAPRDQPFQGFPAGEWHEVPDPAGARAADPPGRLPATAAR